MLLYMCDLSENCGKNICKHVVYMMSYTLYIYSCKNVLFNFVEIRKIISEHNKNKIKK